MSVANLKKNNKINRNSLVIESIKMIKEIKPKIFIFENVSAFLKTACIDIDQNIKSIQEAINYNLNDHYVIMSRVINFKDYGSNSSRTRTLVIGVRMDFEDSISPIDLFPKRQKEKTLKQVIGKLKPLTEFGAISGYVENLIALTPSQHFQKAHFDGNTRMIDKGFQQICLLAKADHIEQNIKFGKEVIYSFDNFVYVLSVGFDDNKYEEVENMNFIELIRLINMEYISATN